MLRNYIQITFNRGMMRYEGLPVDTHVQILKKLPDGSKIIGFGEAISEDLITLNVYNKEFEQLEDGRRIPRVHAMFTREGFDKFSSCELKVDQLNFLNGGNAYPMLRSLLDYVSPKLEETPVKFGEEASADIIGGIGYGSPNTTITRYDPYPTINKAQLRQRSLVHLAADKLTVGLKPCEHILVTYTGFTEEYNYCKKCDKRVD